MNTLYSRPVNSASGKNKWNRADTAKLVSGFEAMDRTTSQREFAKKADVPRSTLRYWLARKNSIDADPAVVEFFESPIGIAFLHRLITAVHVSFTKDGTASIHNVSDFLERSGLCAFVASSYSAQHRVSEQINKKIIEFGKIEDTRLGQQMPARA